MDKEIKFYVTLDKKMFNTMVDNYKKNKQNFIIFRKNDIEIWSKSIPYYGDMKNVYTKLNSHKIVNREDKKENEMFEYVNYIYGENEHIYIKYTDICMLFMEIIIAYEKIMQFTPKSEEQQDDEESLGDSFTPLPLTQNN